MATLKNSVKNAVIKASGSTFFVTKKILATAVLTTASDLTTTATGRLAIMGITLQTDATGLNSTSNAFTITQNGTFGAATLVSQITSGLGANVSLSYGGGTHPTTGMQAVLDSGSKLQFQVASAAATGLGYIQVTVEFKRVDENAQCTNA